MDISKFRDCVNSHVFEVLLGLSVFDLLIITLVVYLLSARYVTEESALIGNSIDEGMVSEIELSDTSDTDDCQIKVNISGAVNESGVVCLNSNAIVNDVIEKSGGFTDDACFEYVDKSINLAKSLENGEKLYIPYDFDLECSVDNEDSVDLSTNSCVSINSASSSQLESLSGVGPATASNIIDGRPYANLDELLNVAGIGSVTLDKFKDEICL